MVGLVDFSNPMFKYNYKGYTAIINQVIDIAINHFDKYNNLNLIISDQQILELFNPTYKDEIYSYNASNVFLENFINNKTRHNKHNAHTIADIEDLKIRNKIFNDLLTPKKEIIEEVELLNKKLTIDDRTLALQIRGTDKQIEIPKVSDDIIIRSIEKFLKENNLNKLFLSTDDIHYLELIKKYFSDNLLYNENNLISTDGQPIHFSKNRSRANKDVLLDVYLLSNCKYFLYCFSNVSYLALTIGSKRLKNIKNINNEN
jgi:hypothetical protein